MAAIAQILSGNKADVMSWVRKLSAIYTKNSNQVAACQGSEERPQLAKVKYLECILCVRMMKQVISRMP